MVVYSRDWAHTRPSSPAAPAARLTPLRSKFSIRAARLALPSSSAALAARSQCLLASGFQNIQNVVRMLKKGPSGYHYIELMALWAV